MSRIYFDSLQINSISNASGVFSGLNVQHTWRHDIKQNEGFGSFIGDGNVASSGMSILNDADVIDQWVRQTIDKCT